jgi:DNA-binding MarR family transcriptional regulator
MERGTTRRSLLLKCGHVETTLCPVSGHRRTTFEHERAGSGSQPGRNRRKINSALKRRGNFTAGLTTDTTDVYTYTVRREALEKQSPLFDLPCACQNLRRVTRVVTRIYDQELRKAGLEVTQFGLLTALAAMREANQKRLSAGFAMDSTTLTRTLGLVLKRGWVRVRRGRDRRERLFRLTPAGKRKMADAERYWARAEQRLRRELGDEGWKSMKQTVSRITEAAMAA